jgi:hypothetical protein
MKALTISQPFASLIASGEKWVENRSWYTSYRGPLAIHAGKGTQYLDREEIKCYTTGSIIATARLSACVVREELQRMAFHSITNGSELIPGAKVTWRQAFDHAHTEGPWCWILEDVEAIDPIQVKGAQNLWVIPSEILEAIASSQKAQVSL